MIDVKKQISALLESEEATETTTSNEDITKADEDYRALFDGKLSPDLSHILKGQGLTHLFIINMIGSGSNSSMDFNERGERLENLLVSRNPLHLRWWKEMDTVKALSVSSFGIVILVVVLNFLDSDEVNVKVVNCLEVGCQLHTVGDFGCIADAAQENSSDQSEVSEKFIPIRSDKTETVTCPPIRQGLDESHNPNQSQALPKSSNLCPKKYGAYIAYCPKP